MNSDSKTIHTESYKGHEIVHVLIRDAEKGDTLADVDATSTADAMAYYLRSRHINEAEADRIDRQYGRLCTWPTPDATARFVYEDRCIITGRLLVGLFAEIKNER